MSARKKCSATITRSRMSSKAAHPNAAKAFLDYFYSDDSLKIMAKSGEFVTRKGIYPPLPTRKRFKSSQMDEPDANTMAEKRKEYRKYFNKWSMEYGMWSIGTHHSSTPHSIIPPKRIPMKLYTFFRSSASYRVRIALNLKGLSYEQARDPSAPRRRRATDAGLQSAQSASAGAGAGRQRQGSHPVAGDHRISRRNPSQSAAAAQRPGRQSAGAQHGVGDRLRSPSDPESARAQLRQSDLQSDRRTGKQVGAALDRSRTVGACKR